MLGTDQVTARKSGHLHCPRHLELVPVDVEDPEEVHLLLSLGRQEEEREHLIPGQTMSFSSYPGLIYSGDDFYLISTGLAVTETTIGNSNKDLWKFVKPKGQILEGVRTMVANRLAQSGKHWSKLFAKRNSGTYNNQWMVLDYNKFEPGKDVANTKGLLWVLEQLPGQLIKLVLCYMRL